MAYHHQNNEIEGGGRLVLILRVVGILVLVGASAGIALYRSAVGNWLARTLAISGNEEPIPVQLLERGPLQLELQAEGEIVGLESIPVVTPNTGTGALTLGWMVPEGTMITSGEPLIRFDSTDALLNLESQNNTLNENRLQTRIDISGQQLSESSLSLDRTMAQMDYEYAGKTKPEDPLIFSQWEIITARVNAEFAKSKIENMAARARTLKRQDRSSQQISEIARNRAQTEVDILQQALGSMEVNAPTGGLVIYRRDRRQDPKIGDTCQPGQVMIDLVDLNALQARIYVLEKEAGGLAKGESVAIRLDAFPAREFHGEVRTISSLAATIEYNGVLKYYTCDVTIRDARPYLRMIKPGMTMQARIILLKYDSCFVVPASALDYREKEDKTFVYIKKGESFEKREVKIGLGKHGQATILSGVADKELIALRNPFESRKLSLPDFSKASADNQGRRGGPPPPGMEGGDFMRGMGPPPGGDRGR